MRQASFGWYSAASTEPGGGSRLRSSTGASSVRLRSLPFEFRFVTLDCRVRRLVFEVNRKEICKGQSSFVKEAARAGP